jgi:hypothetical protein
MKSTEYEERLLVSTLNDSCDIFQAHEIRSNPQSLKFDILAGSCISRSFLTQVPHQNKSSDLKPGMPVQMPDTRVTFTNLTHLEEDSLQIGDCTPAKRTLLRCVANAGGARLTEFCMKARLHSSVHFCCQANNACRHVAIGWLRCIIA